MNWFHALTIVFVIAKLANIIQWSWWVVFAPSLIMCAIGLLILFVGLFVVLKS